MNKCTNFHSLILTNDSAWKIASDASSTPTAPKMVDADAAEDYNQPILIYMTINLFSPKN